MKRLWFFVLTGFIFFGGYMYLQNQGFFQDVPSPVLENFSRSKILRPNVFVEKYAPVDVVYNQEVKSIFQNKCFDCHSIHTKYPWFYKLDAAKKIMDKDIKAAREYLDMSWDFPFGDDVQPETQLTLIKKVIEKNSMPPLRYTLVNFGSGLSSREKKVILDWVEQSQNILSKAQNSFMSGGEKVLVNEPISPLPEQHNFDKNKVELGNMLFHDKRLSRDNSISCAHCHDLSMAGVDRKVFSEGVDGVIGEMNSPTVYNVGFNYKQFWDGRADTLEDQMNEPLTSSKEMATNWPDVLAKLRQDEKMKNIFQQSYEDGITQENIQDAMATFQRSLITPSRFDEYLRGNFDVLTQEEKQGYRLFKEYGCTSCHQGVNIGGAVFERIGIWGDYFADRGKPIRQVDYGRFNVTSREQDKFKFKVPSLRNVALTQPYFHDGSVDQLDKAIEMMAKYQLGRTIPPKDVELIRKFLETLTGRYNGKILE